MQVLGLTIWRIEPAEQNTSISLPNTQVLCTTDRQVPLRGRDITNENMKHGLAKKFNYLTEKISLFSLNTGRVLSKSTYCPSGENTVWIPIDNPPLPE